MSALREIRAEEIAAAVAKLCVEANYLIGSDIEDALLRAREAETRGLPQNVLSQLIENARIARESCEPLCQDTGMAVVFAELGQDVHVSGSLTGAIDEGVRRGYEEGFLRKSVVRDPIDRVNTNDNTPAVVHFDVVPGDRIKLIVAPKGFGSENMSRIAMLKPSQGFKGIRNFVVETVRIAGPNPCPPVIVGVGIGGTMEKACLIAKRSLLRPVGTPNADPFWNGAEQELLEEINELDIGPAGFGGIATALAVHIEVFPTHIAGLPVAVNLGCHATRHAEAIL